MNWKKLLKNSIFMLFLSLVFLAGSFQNVLATTNASLSFTPTSQTKVGTGRTGTINAYINPGGEKVASIELEITFNPSVVRVDGIVPGAFFTSASVGSPIEIVKQIDNTGGKIHYALGFPLGSNYYSTSQNIAAVISFTTVGLGTSNFTYVRTGTPSTQVSDINALNVLGTVSTGSVVVTSSTTSTPTPRVTTTVTPRPTNTVTPRPTNTVTPRPTNTVTPRPSSTPTPRLSSTITPTPQSNKATLSLLPSSQSLLTNKPGSLSVNVDPGGNSVSSMELVITFNPSVINVSNITPGPFFTDPAVGTPVEVIKQIDNTAGKIHYAVGFPLGSNFSSTAVKTAATITFTTVGAGTTQLPFVVSGTPSTQVANLSAQNVLGTTYPASVTVTGGTTVTVTPRPTVTGTSPSPTSVPGTATLSLRPSPQNLGINQFGTLNVFVEPNQSLVSSMELVITFNPRVVRVDNIVPGPFFMDPAVGTPIEVIKTIDNTAGKIHYALGFPLGSNFSSTASKVAAIIAFTTIGSGTSQFTFVTSGTPSTQVSNLQAQNVLGTVIGGTVIVGTGNSPTPTIGGPTPTTNPNLTPTPTGPPIFEGCKTSSNSWQNISFPAQTAPFVAEFDATPDSNLPARYHRIMFAYVGFSSSQAQLVKHGDDNEDEDEDFDDFINLAAITTFDPRGYISIRNSHKYSETSRIPYQMGLTYHFRVIVDLSNHTYSVFVTPAGGKEFQIADNFKFRLEQKNTSSLDTLSFFTRTKRRSLKICNLSITPYNPNVTPGLTSTPKPVTPTPAAGEPTPTITPCIPTQGDANGDHLVNLDDFNIWLAHYNKNSDQGAAEGDFDCSGIVDGVDYVIWLNTYIQNVTPGPTHPPSDTSTPTTVVTTTPTSIP